MCDALIPEKSTQIERGEIGSDHSRDRSGKAAAKGKTRLPAVLAKI